MGTDDDTVPEYYSSDELKLAAMLQAAKPEVSDALRVRVHSVVVRGAEERSLRRRAAMLLLAGTAMMVMAIVGAIT